MVLRHLVSCSGGSRFTLDESDKSHSRHRYVKSIILIKTRCLCLSSGHYSSYRHAEILIRIRRYAGPRSPLCMFYFLFARFSCTIPPIFPSALKCWPMEPFLSSGPPIFCAVPPIAPSAVSGVSVFHGRVILCGGGHRTVKHRSQRPVFREHAGSSSCGLFTCGGLRFLALVQQSMQWRV